MVVDREHCECSLTADSREGVNSRGIALQVNRARDYSNLCCRNAVTETQSTNLDGETFNNSPE